MIIKIDYDKMLIILQDVDAMSNIYKLLIEMDDNNFTWHDTEWKEYLKNNYDIDGGVTYNDWGKMLFF